jgi:hypothetical protein
VVLLGQGQGTGLEKVHFASQGLVSGLASDCGVVIMLGKVRQNQERSLAVIVFLKELGQGGVGKMAHTAHDPLLDHPGVGPVPQHFQVMVRFNHQPIAPAQMVFHAVRQVAQVSDNANLDAVGFEGKAAGISRIVRNGECRYRDVGNLKTAAYMKMFAPLQLRRLAFRIFGRSPPRTE